MEEILASIRKIISEDSNEAAPQAQPSQPAAPAVVAEADVLELTHEFREEPTPAQAVAAPPQPAPAPEPVRPADDIVFQTVEEAPVGVVAQSPAHSSDELVSDKARSAIDDALSGLDIGPQEQAAAAEPVAPVDGRSVEAAFDRAIRETFDLVLRSWLHDQADVIVERMKPAIREWMEDNLPAMLKSAVEAEVARAVRARTKR
jgi:cell pole-organizing protein PopZ